MQPIHYLKAAERALAGIQQGALLTVRSGEAINTMTIGWATIGYVWHKPVLMVAVRNTRHTFGLIEAAPDFTVSVPSAEMSAETRDAIKFCGTRSGREVDKFGACKLATVPGQKTHTPIVDFAGYHFECKRIYKSAMDECQLDPSLKTLYPKNDYHTLYFGEILACYEVTR